MEDILGLMELEEDLDLSVEDDELDERDDDLLFEEEESYGSRQAELYDLWKREH